MNGCGEDEGDGTGDWMPKVIGLDIGGSLVKGVVASAENRGEYNTFQAPINDFEEVLRLLSENYPSGHLSVTGGGACKHKERIEALWASAQFHDEIGAINAGIHLFIDDFARGKEMLFVNAGTGVSFIRSDSEGHYRRLGGTAVGGGTFVGLAKALTGITQFDDLLKIAKLGRLDTVNVLVNDIYGTGYPEAKLASDDVASFLGKAAVLQREPENNEAYTADVLLSILNLICQNLAQLATLYAQLTGASLICFSGGLVGESDWIQDIISRNVQRFSAMPAEVKFLPHSLHVTAIGAAQLWEDMATTRL